MKHVQLKVETVFADGVRLTGLGQVVTVSDEAAAHLITEGLVEDVSEDFADADADSPATKPAKAGK